MCGMLQEHGRLPPQLLLQCNKPRLCRKSICGASGYFGAALPSDALQASPVKVHKDHPVHLIAVYNMPNNVRQSYIAMHSRILVSIKLHSGMLLSMLQSLSCQGRGTLPSRCCQGLWLTASLHWNSLPSPRSQYAQGEPSISGRQKLHLHNIPLPTKAFDMQLKANQYIIVMAGHSQMSTKHMQFLSAHVCLSSNVDVKAL